MDLTDPRFSGITRLYGQKALERFHQARVCVVGIGGVGSWIAESLARSGVGTIILMDMDDICITNTNRQIHTTSETHGQPKVSAMADRLRTISPDCNIIQHNTFYTEKSAQTLWTLKPDIILDAIDSIKHKCHLIAECYTRAIPIITCGGAGGRIDPTQIKTADLTKTNNDPLLSQVRKILRKEYHLPLEDKAPPVGISCVFSPEKTVYPQCDGSISSSKDKEYAQGRMSCESGFGSATHITGIFGLAMAGLALNQLSTHTTHE